MDGYNFIESIDIGCSPNVWTEGEPITLTIIARNEWNLEVDFSYCNVTIESISPKPYILSGANSTARGTGYFGTFTVSWENQGWATNATHVFTITTRMLKGITPARAGTEQPIVPSIWVFDSIGGNTNRCVHVLPLQASKITIQPDGTVTPSNSPITRDGDNYKLTSDANRTIQIFRNNCHLDGGDFSVSNVSDTGNDAGVYIKAENVTIENLKASHCDTGVSLDNCTKCTLEHDAIYNNTKVGVILQGGSQDNTVKGNIIYNNGWGKETPTSQTGIVALHSGVAVLNSSNNTISGNKLTLNDAYNIYLLKADSNTVANNTSTLGSRGIYLDKANGNEIVNNNVTQIIAYGIIISTSNKNFVHHNNLNKNRMGGILLGESNYTQVIGNAIKGKGDGINLSSCNSNTISGNNISNATEGIMLNGDNADNNLYSNVVKGCKSGIDLLKTGKGNMISYNVLMDNLPYGLQFGGSDNVTAMSGSSIFSNTIALTGTLTAGNENAPGEVSSIGISLGRTQGLKVYNNTVIRYKVCFDINQNNGDRIYNNKIVNESGSAVVLHNSTDIAWDNGYPTGGNYWSDYAGSDTHSGPNQDQSGADGIGDTPCKPVAFGSIQGHVLTDPIDLSDRYPLMSSSAKPTSTKIAVNGKESVVTIVTSSTLLQVAAATDALNFTVTGVDGTMGYARVTCPKTNTTALRAYIDGKPLASSITSDDSYYYILIQFHLSTHVITIHYAKPRNPSSISCIIPEQTTDSGDPVTITGVLNPALSNTTPSLIITKPSGQRSVVSLGAKSDGSFNYTFTPKDVGTWKAQAIWAGNDAYSNSTSPTRTWSVVKSTSSNSTNGVPGYTIEEIIVGIIISIVLLFWMRRKQ